MPEPSTEEKEGEDQPSVRDTKRARGEPEQDLSGEISVSADETLNSPEVPAAPSNVIPSNSTSTPISPGASSSSGVKRTYSESTALLNSPGVSSGSGVKRAHGESIVDDDDTCLDFNTTLSQRCTAECRVALRAVNFCSC